jgi:predicted nucleic acid-binding protein
LTTVFFDTVGLIALWDEADQWHDAAQQAFAKLLQSRAKGVTTNAVLLECGNAAARRPYRHEVNQLRQHMAAIGRLVILTDVEWDAAWTAYDHREASGAGIVDRSTFIAMRRLGLTQAFTNDSHFTAAGFETLF